MQVSSKSLSKKKEAEVFARLHFLLADARHPDEITQFLSSFLTETEHLVLAKRLTIYYLLDKGQSYTQIKNELQVSSATISTVSENMKNSTIQSVINRIRIIERANNWYQQIKKLWP